MLIFLSIFQIKPDQLNTIRKFTYAKLLCDNSDHIKQLQRWLMRPASADNPRVDCSDIPGLDFSKWKDVPTKTIPVYYY